MTRLHKRKLPGENSSKYRSPRLRLLNLFVFKGFYSVRFPGSFFWMPNRILHGKSSYL